MDVRTIYICTPIFCKTPFVSKFLELVHTESENTQVFVKRYTHTHAHTAADKSNITICITTIVIYKCTPYERSTMLKIWRPSFRVIFNVVLYSSAILLHTVCCTQNYVMLLMMIDLANFGTKSGRHERDQREHLRNFRTPAWGKFSSSFRSTYV